MEKVDSLQKRKVQVEEEGDDDEDGFIGPPMPIAPVKKKKSELNKFYISICLWIASYTLRVQNLANLANFDKIRQIKYSPNLR